MLVALSGTPGTGKTSVSALLQNKGYTIINLNELAVDKGFVTGIDRKRNSKIIDIGGLNEYINDFCKTKEIVFIDGHASHLLSIVENVILLRCHPRELRNRLQKKDWPLEKIKENVDAETLDVILCEAVECYPEEHIFEIDTTNKTIKFVLLSVMEIVNSNFKLTKKYKIGKIDWSEEILKDF
ncbi:MAG: adenylate kinase family protein [Thermoplasmatales archaeon]|nr:MAG: adenylate kinase family protein [Thermoplasmatales archaeon]